MVLIMESAGCVCQPTEDTGAQVNAGAASGASGGAAIVTAAAAAAQVAMQQQQRATQSTSH